MHDSTQDDLSPEERQFLSLVAPIGLDWLTTRSEFRKRHGHRPYSDWSDVIPLPATTALSDSPLEFMMYDDYKTLDLAPEHLWAYFMPYQDARKNHREIETQLITRLGQPVVDDVSNCIGRLWRFGVFSVRLLTFPPELQPTELSRAGVNPLLDKNPQLRAASTVILESEYAKVLPDQQLNAGATILQRKPSESSSCVIITRTSDGLISRYPHRRETRRNPTILAKLILHEQLIAWRDDAANRIGLSAQRDSYLFDRNTASHLVLMHVEPARGPGGYRLFYVPDNRANLYDDNTIQLFDDGPHSSLPITAKQLSETWQIPLSHDTGVDD